jgi:saccharopine dehydrogenase-like NADP-dependent oxidoreductase
MKQILLIGAGRSASNLIKYLIEKSSTNNFSLCIADLSEESAREKAGTTNNVLCLGLDIRDSQKRGEAVQKADVVISMLPAFMHVDLAKDCLKYKKHLVTASYISEEMKSLNTEVEAAGLVFMNEIGLDPGIDHMSAMKVIDEIRSKGGKMLLFESFTGGLVAPESDDNLWNYKFTWNPRNVVLAGQGGAAKFIQEGKYKYIPYQKLFRRTEVLSIPDVGKFEGYANRDSLKYREIYGLEGIKTLFRGTIRRLGFSKSWDLLVQLGMTDDSYVIENSENMSYRDFTNSFLAYNTEDSVELKLRSYLQIAQDDLRWEKIKELDLFNANKKVGLKDASPAQILEKILSDVWSLSADDKDMIVMLHKFGYELNGEKKQIESSMLVKGDDQTYTAMAKTVGLPVGIAAVKILLGEIDKPGVQIPLSKEIYKPILSELEDHGIHFKEVEVAFGS